ncbi:MAG: hypothetical protein S4CHLAM6_05310 [Chlamydiae bacterium]|nr:hypothetical protein [Chlamydiota bacterium]
MEPVYHTSNFNFEIVQPEGESGADVKISWKGREITVHSPIIEDSAHPMSGEEGEPNKAGLTPLHLSHDVTVYVDLKQSKPLPSDVDQIKAVKRLRSFANKINAQQAAALKFDEELTRWSTDPSVEVGEREHRVDAAARMRVCIESKDKKMDLSYLQLSSLPDGFVEQFEYLTDLNLSNNKLRALPENFGKFVNLTLLDVSGNKLQALPASFVKLKKLEQLVLERNQIEALPEDFGQLSSLSLLYLSSNKIESLPESFCRLRHLRVLLISDNFIQFLPVDFGQLTILEELNLRNNMLRALPESLGQCSKLVSIDVESNKLQALPDVFGELPDLRNFFVQENPLRSLPISILDIRLRRKISLDGHNLSEEVLTNFRRLIDARRQDGQQVASFSFDMPEPRSSTDPQSIDRSFKALKLLAKYEELPFDIGLFTADGHPAQLWLHNLLETTDFTEGSDELQKKLAQVVLGFFKYVADNPDFVEFFDLFLDTANVSCVDRTTMSVIDLEILINLKEAQGTSVSPLKQLRAVWATHLLHQIASDKVASMPLVDELDTHLAYLIQCKEGLALRGIKVPFSSEKMKFFTYAITGVKQDDLDGATTAVLGTMSGDDWSEQLVDFLFEEDNYTATASLEMFRAFFATEVASIKKRKELLSDRAEELAGKASDDEVAPKDKPTDKEVQEAYKTVQDYEKKAYAKLVQSMS